MNQSRSATYQSIVSNYILYIYLNISYIRMCYNKIYT